MKLLSFSQIRKACAQIDTLLILLYIKSLAQLATFVTYYTLLHIILGFHFCNCNFADDDALEKSHFIQAHLFPSFLLEEPRKSNCDSPTGSAKIGKGVVEKQRVRSVTSVFPERLF